MRGLAKGFSSGSAAKHLPASAEGPGSIPESGRFPGEGNGNPLQYSGKFHGQRTQASYSPWDHKEPDMTEGAWVWSYRKERKPLSRFRGPTFSDLMEKSSSWAMYMDARLIVLHTQAKTHCLWVFPRKHIEIWDQKAKAIVLPSSKTGNNSTPCDFWQRDWFKGNSSGKTGYFLFYGNGS